MAYLCLAHRVQVARSAELAQQLWLRAFQLGQDAFSRRDWPAAECGFGCAFDIAKIRMNDVARGQISAFDEAQLVVSAECFAQVLSQSLQFSRADSVTQFVRHHLLRKLAHANVTESKSACLRSYLKSIETLGLKISETHLSGRVKTLKVFSDTNLIAWVH